MPASFRVVPNSTGQSTTFNLPDGRSVFVSLVTFWSYSNNPPPIPSPTSTPAPQAGMVTIIVNAAYQLFENGFLLWRADSGRIDEFDKYDVAGYNLDQYQSLPDNPVSDQAPAGRVKPINGFGRVWGNFPSTRNALGWGLAIEQGYQATFKMDIATDVFCVNLPDGRFVSYPHFDGKRSYTWQYENSCG